MDATFSWKSRVEAILSKATKRIYFLKLLNLAGVPHAQLLNFYLVVIRPVLEYTAPVFHHLLSKLQTDQIGAIQKRGLNIIFTCTYGMPYSSVVSCWTHQPHSTQRTKLARNFFDSTVLTSLTATCTRSCTSLMLKSSFKISSHS